MFRRSPIPLYIQVATLLRNRIADGHFRAGQKMPTQEELEEEFGVARVTVRQAVELLEKEGLVHRQQGRGTFVTPHMPERRWLHLTIDIDSLALSIRGHVPRFLTVKNPAPAPRLLAEDGEPAADVSVSAKRSVPRRGAIRRRQRACGTLDLRACAGGIPL